MMLHTDRDIDESRAGIGTDKTPIEAKEFVKLFRELLYTVRKKNQAPWIWHRSYTIPLVKPGNKTGTQAVRLVHLSDPNSKQFFKGCRARGIHPVVDYTACCFLSSRRREAAIMEQCIASWKLAKYGWVHAGGQDDLSNAFGSTTMRAFRDTTNEIHDQLDARLVHQRHDNVIMHVNAWNGTADFLIKQGGLQGDVLGPPDFVHTFAKPVRQWTEAMQEEYEGRLLISCCPSTVKHETHEVDLAYSSFADDTARVHVGSSAPEVAEKLFISHHILKDCLQPYGWNANETKHEANLQSDGEGSTKTEKGDY